MTKKREVCQDCHYKNWTPCPAMRSGHREPPKRQSENICGKWTPGAD
jgi:hypothetical protein